MNLFLWFEKSVNDKITNNTKLTQKSPSTDGG